MRILLDDQWRPGYLDPYRHLDEYRIEVLQWRTLETLDQLYFVRPRSLRLLWNYAQDVGVREILRRVASRRREQGRNQKVVACGTGRVVEAPEGGRFAPGDLVTFVAPSHPPCVERLVMPEALLAKAPAVLVAGAGAGLRYLTESVGAAAPTARWWNAVRGWSRYSGIKLDPAVLGPILTRAQEEIEQAPWNECRELDLHGPEPIAEARAGLGVQSPKPTGALFGYGNYAKVVILPNIATAVEVTRVHEIDPTQAVGDGGARWAWDTSPMPRAADGVQVYFVAGYHATHAPLAIEALRRGAYSVVEKPLVVDREQLRALLAAVTQVPKYFACFQKRYHAFNALARQDLGARSGDPVSYHCIVYEVPLPLLHWYRWPSSRSRLLSNGCHWVDHFLFLNEFAQVRDLGLLRASDGTINCSIELENDAVFTMTLTDRGSERIGVQDYIELRMGSTTATMVNGSSYRAESRDRVVRRARANKMRAYSAMYRAIAARIARGENGDPASWIQLSAGTVLDLEELHGSALRRGKGMSE